MSGNEEQGGAGRREVAYRLFASEFDDSDFSYSESDEERAPNYVVTPTGTRVNRLFVVGVLTEVETVSEDYLRARIVDPSGPFVVYAGQYQPEALAFLESAEPPAFVAVTGKARTYQPDDSDQVYTSVRPESISEVDAATRDRWVVQTAAQTLDRVAHAAEAKQTELLGDDLQEVLLEHGVEDGLAAGIPIALEHYGTTGDYLSAVRDLAVDATRVVANERDEIEQFGVLPDQGDDASLASLVGRPVDIDIHTDEAVAEEAEEPETGRESTDDVRAGTAEARTETTQTDSEETSATTDIGESAGTQSTAEAKPETTASQTEPGSTDDDTVDVDPGDTPATDEDSAPTVEASPSSSEPGTASADDGSGAGVESSIGGDEDTDTTPSPSPDTNTETESSPDAESDDLGDFDPEFDLDEDEREEIESEYGTEFQSGTEVDDPGEADIEAPDPDENEGDGPQADAAVDEAETESATAVDNEEVGTAATDETGDDSASDEATDAVDTNDAEPADDVDLEDAVMDAMGELDDGDGAERDAIVDAVVDRTGSDSEAVEDAIQDALMGGRCYEPDDDVLKPI